MKKALSVVLLVVMFLSFVACEKSSNVKNVEDQIDSIGDVSLNSGVLLSQIENSYNALSDKEKTQVDNYQVFTTAKSLYQELVAQKEKEDQKNKLLEPVQKFAGDLIIEAAFRFDNPLSIHVKNVWYSEMSHRDGVEISYIKLTYELEIQNAYGIAETAFYGTPYYINISDEESRDIALEIVHWESINIAAGGRASDSRFRKNEIDAMQNGEPLNAEEIQTYFLKNY